ncbi:uncharacterized protein [Rutidosis leptorrhynchoides]|uniref:uncharacterized protein n=1 Tax=Rutidosis leptorrhynchoides TaxID=125765 RepID=UPI003A996E8F
MNDAIDTIIRKYETMEENGEFLPPCVEAALNLGCVPVKSSRSQRNSNTINYLSPRNEDSGPNVQKPNFVDRTSTISEANKDIRPNLIVNPPGPSFYPPTFENLPRQMMSFENRPSSLYPLYQGFQFQPRAPQIGFQSIHQNSNKIIVRTPVFQAAREPLPPFSQTGCHERLFLFDSKEDNSSKKEIQPKLAECDLSLRLGPVVSDRNHDVDDLDPRSREFSFFPLNSEAEKVDHTVKDDRKRKQ